MTQQEASRHQETQAVVAMYSMQVNLPLKQLLGG